ncbi:hypothetical protein VULLAG_LOCUS20422 [Vulpes lagopus]
MDCWGHRTQLYFQPWLDPDHQTLDFQPSGEYRKRTGLINWVSSDASRLTTYMAAPNSPEKKLRTGNAKTQAGNHHASPCLVLGTCGAVAPTPHCGTRAPVGLFSRQYVRSVWRAQLCLHPHPGGSCL